MVLGDAEGLPLAVHLEAASPAEVTLVEPTLAACALAELPVRLIADKAYDSDKLRVQLLEKEVVLLSPHRRGRKRLAWNDGCWLRRYRKRWKIERLFAWLFNFRRLVVRYEFHHHNFLALFQLACALVLLKQLR